MSEKLALPSPNSKVVRLFLALWPDSVTRAALDKAAMKLLPQCGGRKTRSETLHMTLVFLGDVPESRLEALRASMADIAMPAFNVPISKVGRWCHNRIVWAGTDAAPAALAALVEQLRERLAAAGFAFDAKAYVPHVTLLRKTHSPEQAFFPLALEWPAREFVLVRSVLGDKGAAYEIIGRWELQR